MITVQWPSSVASKAQVWRVLDLSGMTTSVRQSRNFTKAGYVYVNGNRIYGLKAVVSVGEKFTLELRYPNGKIVSKSIMLTTRNYTRKARNNEKPELKYKG